MLTVLIAIGVLGALGWLLTTMLFFGLAALHDDDDRGDEGSGSRSGGSSE